MKVRLSAWSCSRFNLGIHQYRAESLTFMFSQFFSLFLLCFSKVLIVSVERITLRARQMQPLVISLSLNLFKLTIRPLENRSDCERFTLS